MALNLFSIRNLQKTQSLERLFSIHNNLPQQPGQEQELALTVKNGKKPVTGIMEFRLPE